MFHWTLADKGHVDCTKWPLCVSIVGDMTRWCCGRLAVQWSSDIRLCWWCLGVEVLVSGGRWPWHVAFLFGGLSSAYHSVCAWVVCMGGVAV